jgi:hypothetical protein
MPTELITQVAFIGPSGIPRDQFENTFHFTLDAGTDADGAMAAHALVASFFLNVHGSNSVASYLSGKMSRTATLKSYIEGHAIPRPIFRQDTFTLPTPLANTGIPEEIALCLSYYAGVNLPRRRGRIYIGPLNTDAIEQDVDPRPAADFVSTIHDAAVALAATGTVPSGDFTNLTGSPSPAVAGHITWCVKSTNGGAVKTPHMVVYQPITNGWIDNEWDGQSRRRLAASARSTF